MAEGAGESPDRTAAALESIEYELREPFDPRDNTAHRFVRGNDVVDVVSSSAGDDDVVDVLIADHPGPSIIETLMGRDMVRIPGGTRALRRTVNARLEIEPGTMTTISVPRAFGALILKAAAFGSDSRDRDRHLADAAALLACIENPFAERDGIAGSDRRRLTTLQRELTEDHLAWLRLPEDRRSDARAALRLLCVPT